MFDHTVKSIDLDQKHNGQINFEVADGWVKKWFSRKSIFGRFFFPIAESEELLKRKRLRKSR